MQRASARRRRRQGRPVRDPYIPSPLPTERHRRSARRQSSYPTPAPDEIRFTPEDWIKVVERAIEIAGEDHVMLGSDLDGGPTQTHGMRELRYLPLLTE